MQFDEASKALVELAASRQNAFHSSEAAEVANISTRRLKRAADRGELVRLAPRIWAVASLGQPPGQRLRAKTLTTTGAVAAQRSSGWLHRWFDELPTNVDLWVPGHGRRSVTGTILHRCAKVDPRLDVTVVDGVSTLNPAATLCLLGRTEPDDVVEECLDLFRRDHSLRWLEATLERLSTTTGAGPAALRRVMNHPRRQHGAVESIFERRVQRLLTVADLPPISLQHEVEIGGRCYRLDLAMPSIKLGVEAHSRQFHWGRQSEEADNVRDMHLAAYGWQLLYLTWDQLQDPEAVVTMIEHASLARRSIAAPSAARTAK